MPARAEDGRQNHAIAHADARHLAGQHERPEEQAGGTPRPSTPKLGIFNSRTSNPSPNTMSSSPMVLIGSTWKAKNASNRQRPPATPGSTAPGFHNSTTRPSVPERQQSRQSGDRQWRSGTADAASSPRARRRCRGAKGHRAPVEPGHRAAIELPQDVTHVRGDEIDEPGSRGERLARRERTALCHGLRRERSVPPRVSASVRA